MGNSKALALAALFTPGLLQSAWAADLYVPPPAPSPPPRMEMPAEKQVVVNDGYYLRGDIGVGMTKHTITSQFSSAVPSPLFDSSAIGDSTFFRFGAGRQFGSWFRSDLTFEYRASAMITAIESYNQGAFFVPPAATRSWDNYSGHISHGAFLLNGYADLGTWQRLSPFIGLGVGYAMHRVADLKDAGGVSAISTTSYGVGGFGYADAKTSGSLAWAGMAGVGFHVNDNLKLEVAYRYLNLGTAKSGVIKCLTQPVASCPNEIQSYKLSSHDFSLGMRWMLGGSMSYQQQAKFDMGAEQARPKIKVTKDSYYDTVPSAPVTYKNSYAAGGPAEIDPRATQTIQSANTNSDMKIIPLVPEANELSKADLPAQQSNGKKNQPRKAASANTNNLSITPERLY